MKKSLTTFFLATTLAFPAAAAPLDVPAGTYKLDDSHASLTFTVSHMGFTDYTAGFDDFDATLELDPKNPEKSKVTATIDPTSLDLPSPPDGFVKEISTGDKWLDAGKHKHITFTSTKIEKTGDKTAKIHGDLTMLGQTHPVVLDTTFNGGYRGIPRDPNARVGFSAEGTFKRSDYGMTYGIPEPGTTMGVGDEITVYIEAEFSGPPKNKTTE